MKKNLILMTALFAGTMLINDGFALPRTPVDKAPVEPDTVSIEDYNAVDVRLGMSLDHYDNLKKIFYAQQEELRNLRNENLMLNNTLNAKQAEIVGLQTQINNLTEQINTLQTEKSELNNTLNNKQAEIVELQTQINNLTTQINTLQTEKTALEEMLNNTQKEIAELQKQINTLEEENERLTTQINDLKAENEKLESEKSVPATESSEDTAKISELQTQINTLQTENSALEGKLNNKQAEIDNLTKEKSAWKQYSEILPDYYKEINPYSKGKRTKKRLNTLRPKYDLMMSKIEKLQNSNDAILDDSLSNKLKDLAEDIKNILSSYKNCSQDDMIINNEGVEE